MVIKKCSHLVEQGCVSRRDHYTCDVTGDICAATSYDNPDPGHPASYDSAKYHAHSAVKCPGYDVPDDLLERVREHWKDN
jgi:hypothetical protein